MHCHMKILQQVQISDMFKLSSKTRSEAKKQVEAHSAKSTPLDLDMATLTLDTASVGVTTLDNDPAVKQEHAIALSDEEAW